MKDRYFSFFKFIGEYSFYGILFFIPISNSFIEIFAGLMFFGFVGRKIIRPDFKFIRFGPNIFLISFLFFSVISLINSGRYFNISLHALFGKWAQYLCICIIMQDTIYDKRMISRGVSVFLFGAAIVVLSGLSQYFFGVEFLRHRRVAIIGVDGIRAMTASFPHYNGFGGYLVVVLSLAGALLLGHTSFNMAAVSLSTLSLFSTLAILLTFSRGSWLALVSSIIFTSGLSRKKITPLIPIFLAIIVIFLYPAFHDRLLFSFKLQGDNDRFKYWLAAFKMIHEHPFFGMGVGTFMANYSKYLIGQTLYAHNCYLQIWAETGVFALISFTMFVASVIYLGVKKFLDSKDFLLLGLLSGLVGFLAHSFFDTNLYSLQLAFLFWIWVGMIIRRSDIVD